MTFKDKPKRPGGKPAGRDRKPRSGGEKPFSKGAAAKAGPGAKAAKKPSGDARTAKPAPRRAEAVVAEGVAQAPERISKLLARAGVASRRDIERMIMEGRVSVNGKVLDTPVLNATLADHIEVDGQPIRGIERTRLWIYHKPAGLVTTNSDPEGRPTVFDNLPEALPRVLSIGRLDINTEGLLLLTNDGGLARVLELPATGWLRRYRVRAHGKIEQEALDRLKDGIAVEGVLYGAIEATLDKVQGSNVWITMGLREGKNREIKNVLGALGLDVNRLIRISYGPFQLGELPEGHVQEIRGRTLRDQLGPRLIEDAKANFDAPLFEHEQPAAEEKPARAAAQPAREERSERPFREKDGDRREKARARLDTKRDDFGPKRDRDDDRFADRPKHKPTGHGRTANVWMAPGARPVTEKKTKAAEGEESVKRTPRARPEGAPKVKRYGRTWGDEATRTTNKHDPDRGDRPARAAPRRSAENADARRRVLGAGPEGGDWIRASEPEARPRDGEERGPRRRPSGAGDREARRDFGDRPPRRDGDRPQGDRPRGRPAGGKSFGEKPSGDRPFGDKPRGKPFGGKPGEKSFGGRPAGKSFGGKPGGKSFGGKPGGKPAGGRPAGGGKPRGRGK
ncbi:pseudouridine synthase [Rhizobium sp. TRM95111]|uniref:pseudouridine synthase n=1 Tax=Rhizobium alarense TaxID=2846851 RepID=UPI001F345D61|nr:pseudouridine synthase [Rhizobium alarense]MCF3641455.1 pseudouridine synthase [Rhizobium alarense]